MNIFQQLLCRLGIGGERRQCKQLAQSRDRVAGLVEARLDRAYRDNQREGDSLGQWVREMRERRHATGAGR